jgi:uncharacterized protein YndB with AHSA1/START domain
MVKKILLVLLVAIVGVLGYAATKPDTFRVERKAVVPAPPDRVYAMIEDFHRWGEWSPWEKLDPAMTRTHGGPAKGLGATYAWKGNDDVGEGRMEITEATAQGRVVIKLDFIDPFESSNVTTFTLTPVNGGTEVIWRMEGPMPYVSKLMDTVIGMDRMIGKDFEQGLANMQGVAAR